MKETELDNDRSIMLLTNNDSTFQPLLIMIPQWSKASIALMSTNRQKEIWEQFSHEVGEAWERVLREKINENKS